MHASCFQANLVGVGQERDFYKLKELTSADVRFLKAFIERAGNEHLRSLNEGWLRSFNVVFAYRRAIASKGILGPKQEALLDVLLHNFEEDLHASIEKRGRPYLEMALQEDLSFFKEDTSLIDFLYFLCIQYCRTERQKTATLALTQDAFGVSFERIWNVMTHMIATNVSWTLYAERTQYQAILLQNNSDLEFIAGDQPVINSYADVARRLESLESFDMYYPISPRLAIYYTDRPDWHVSDLRELNEEEVHRFNGMIADNASKQLYASRKETLIRYDRQDRFADSMT